MKDDLTVVKIGILLARRGVEVPPRTLARFAVERCGAGRRKTRCASTTRRRGSNSRLTSAGSGSSPTVTSAGCARGSIFTACFSRHQFVWPTFSQTTEEVIRGFEAAWGYFGGVFPVVIPDNMKSIVIEAENTAPRFNDTFMEYAQSRGFVIDAARVRTPTDKPTSRARRAIRPARTSSPARVSSTLPTARVRAETWCTETAGMRIHGTTQCRPIEVFRTEEQPLLLPLPCGPFDTPAWSEPEGAP